MEMNGCPTCCKLLPQLPQGALFTRSQKLQMQMPPVTLTWHGTSRARPSGSFGRVAMLPENYAHTSKRYTRWSAQNWGSAVSFRLCHWRIACEGMNTPG